MIKPKKDDSIEKAVSIAITTLKDVLKEECDNKDHSKYFLRSTNHDYRKDVFDIMNKLFIENEGNLLELDAIVSYVIENFEKKHSSLFNASNVVTKVLDTHVESGYLNISRNIVRLDDVKMYVYDPCFAKYLITKSNEENKNMQLLDKMFFDDSKKKDLIVEFKMHDTTIYNDGKTIKITPSTYIEYTKLWIRNGATSLAVPSQDYNKWRNGKI